MNYMKAILLAVTFSSARSSFAQTSSTSGERPNGSETDRTADATDVEVHGTPRPDPGTTGASVTTLTRKNLEALPGGMSQPLSYALATQPGFVTDTFGFGMHVRGADGGIQYVLDGIPLQPAPLGQFAAASGFVPPQMIESMTTLIGGYPAEYGAGLGAVVDIVTRRTSPQPRGEIQASYGTYDLRSAQADVSDRLGPLGVVVGAQIVATSRGIDPPSVSPILHDSMTSGSAFILADGDLSAVDSIRIIGMYDNTHLQIPIDPTLLPLGSGPTGSVRGPDPFGNSPPPFVPYNANPTETERNAIAGVSYRRAFGSSTFQLAPFVRESYGDLLCDPTRSLGALADPGSTCSDVRRDVLHEGGTISYAWQTASIHHFKAGALVDVSHTSVDYSSYTRNDNTLQGRADTAVTVTGHDSTNVLLAGAYVQDLIRLGRWTLFPGLRLDMERADFLSTDLPSLVLVGPGARVGASLSVTEALVIHASAGYLWQPPSTLDGPVAARILVPSLAGQAIPVDLKAEQDWSAELGISERVARALTLAVTGWARIADNQLDRVNVGTTNLVASYNFARGRAAGFEATGTLRLGSIIDGFGNIGWQIAQGKGISSERYLFTPDEVADQRWVMLDHVQTWTANVGADLHDEKGSTHVSARVNYGSGMRTGAESDISVPEHTTLDVTIRHRWDVGWMQPELALDVFNVFDDVYAYRIGTGYIGSAYAPLRRVNLRLSVALGDVI